jgi:hypothetical protein
MSLDKDLDFEKRKLLFISKNHAKTLERKDALSKLAEIYVLEKDSGKLNEIIKNNDVDLSKKINIGQKLAEILKENNDFYGLLELKADSQINDSVKSFIDIDLDTALKNEIEKISRYERKRARKDFEKLLSKNLNQEQKSLAGLYLAKLYDDFLVEDKSRDELVKIMNSSDDIIRQSAEKMFYEELKDATGNGLKPSTEILIAVYDTLIYFSNKKISKNQKSNTLRLMEETSSKIPLDTIIKQSLFDKLSKTKMPSYLKEAAGKAFINNFVEVGDYKTLKYYKTKKVSKKINQYIDEKFDEAFKIAFTKYSLEGEPLALKNAIEDYKTTLERKNQQPDINLINKSFSTAIKNAIKNDDKYQELIKIKNWSDLTSKDKKTINQYLKI